ALMADSISWHGTKTALEAAENYGLVSAEASEKYVEHMEATAEGHIRDIYSEKELEQMDSIEEAAYEYLEEHVKVSPIEILAVLSELKLIKVDEAVWSQLLEDEATDTLGELEQ
ncbi:CML16, partial [Symbiodinium pilosum]